MKESIQGPPVRLYEDDDEVVFLPCEMHLFPLDCKKEPNVEAIQLLRSFCEEYGVNCAGLSAPQMAKELHRIVPTDFWGVQV